LRRRGNTMRVELRGKHVPIDPTLRRYAQQRLHKLSRFFDHVAEAHVTASMHRGQYRADVLLNVDGLLLRAEEQAHDLQAALDSAADKLERQLTKFKGKLYSRSRARARQTPLPEAQTLPPVEAAPPAEPADEPTIVRSKRFAMKPMAPEEAALQMELLHHDFYVFRNGDSGQVNVVYRRNDGSYGLIEPEV